MFSVEMVALLPSEVVIMNKSNSTLNTSIGSKNELGSMDKKVVLSSDTYETSQSSNYEKKKTDLPYVFIYMHIKEDGGRELVLKSLLSFKNLTKRTFHLSIRYGFARCDISLRPDEDFNVPIHVAHPGASLFCRDDDINSEYIEMLQSFGSLIMQGVWGAPSRLKTEICYCPPENPSGEDSVESSWVVLLRPEVRDIRNGQSSRSYVSVRYPTDHTRAIIKNFSERDIQMDNNMDAMENVLGNLVSQTWQSMAQPLCLHFVAPLQVCNLICQPLLYRISDKDGYITSEGVLIPGEIIDIHSMFKLFTSQIYISIRMLNFSWSKWSKIFTKNKPYKMKETIIEITLDSLELLYQDNSNLQPIEFMLPNITIILSLRENFLRISCPVVISNRSGLPLFICESDNQNHYHPHQTR